MGWWADGRPWRGSYMGLLSALLDEQLTALVLYFKTKTSLSLGVHIYWRELSFILLTSDMVVCGVALGLGVGFLRRKWSAQREESSLGNGNSSWAKWGCEGERAMAPWAWAVGFESRRASQRPWLQGFSSGTFRKLWVERSQWVYLLRTFRRLQNAMHILKWLSRLGARKWASQTYLTGETFVF